MKIPRHEIVLLDDGDLYSRQASRWGRVCWHGRPMYGRLSSQQSYYSQLQLAYWGCSTLTSPLCCGRELIGPWQPGVLWKKRAGNLAVR